MAEQHDEWTEMRRYFGLEVLAKVRALSEPELPTGGPVTHVKMRA